jgi:hypothetical protein
MGRVPQGAALGWENAGPLARAAQENAVMPQTPVIIIGFILIVVAVFCLKEAKRWRYRRMIYMRTSRTDDWMEAFPNDMASVKRLLEMFSDAFMFNRRYIFHFRPDDVVMHVYKNTTGPVADEMQLERLGMGVQKSFGVDIMDILDNDTTLRDIVHLVTWSKTGVMENSN